jgi:hypothetical protein
LNRQVLLANDFQHLRGAEAVNAHVFRNLRHVTAVGRLVKDNVDAPQRGTHRLAIGYVAFDEFGVVSDPGRLSVAMRLRLEVVQDADAPAFVLQ